MGALPLTKIMIESRSHRLKRSIRAILDLLGLDFSDLLDGDSLQVELSQDSLPSDEPDPDPEVSRTEGWEEF